MLDYIKVKKGKNYTYDMNSLPDNCEIDTVIKIRKDFGLLLYDGEKGRAPTEINTDSYIIGTDPSEID